MKNLPPEHKILFRSEKHFCFYYGFSTLFLLSIPSWIQCRWLVCRWFGLCEIVIFMYPSKVTNMFLYIWKWNECCWLCRIDMCGVRKCSLFFTVDEDDELHRHAPQHPVPAAGETESREVPICGAQWQQGIHSVSSLASLQDKNLPVGRN